MLLTLVLILLLIALVGGLTIHPLLFLLVIVAVVLFAAGRDRTLP